ncbi:DUF3491 domain-containing protein [Salmonella enterica]|nr:DUF3491 domain-containing protein [Salmonella enterica]EKC6528533.1 DUF3491 domain-containing protein [Salmonella enterica]ELL0231185.1 DUF3491 domain-containing protein [Salmonella enterica]QVQ34661.1 DUF3491 domain-containing protein [Salmonella enterica subsp. salamae]
MSPEIPSGHYHTVLLGYGETLRANTEVTQMINGDFREMARAYGEDEIPEPLLSVISQRSQVTGGDAPLTVVVPVVDQMLLGTHVHMVERFKNYHFTLTGGKGGLTVQVGGSGTMILRVIRWPKTCSPTARCPQTSAYARFISRNCAGDLLSSPVRVLRWNGDDAAPTRDQYRGGDDYRLRSDHRKCRG